MDEVLALLLHSVDKVFGLFFHRTDSLFHLVHLILEPKLVFLSAQTKRSVFISVAKSNIASFIRYETGSDLEEPHVQFTGCVASLQVPSDVDVIVSNDASDQVRRGDALCPLSGHKHSW